MAGRKSVTGMALLRALSAETTITHEKGAGVRSKGEVNTIETAVVKVNKNIELQKDHAYRQQVQLRSSSPVMQSSSHSYLLIEKLSKRQDKKMTKITNTMVNHK